MSDPKPKRMVDSLPIKRYSWDHDGIEFEYDQGDYIKLDDLEAILQKLASPKTLNKLVKQLMFGGKGLDLETVLKEE